MIFFYRWIDDQPTCRTEDPVAAKALFLFSLSSIIDNDFK